MILSNQLPEHLILKISILDWLNWSSSSWLYRFVEITQCINKTNWVVLNLVVLTIFKSQAVLRAHTNHVPRLLVQEREKDYTE